MGNIDENVLRYGSKISLTDSMTTHNVKNPISNLLSVPHFIIDAFASHRLPVNCPRVVRNAITKVQPLSHVRLHVDVPAFQPKPNVTSLCPLAPHQLSQYDRLDDPSQHISTRNEDFVPLLHL